MKDEDYIADNDDQSDVVSYEQQPLSTQVRFIDHELEEDVHLRDYLGVVLRRKWVFLAFFITVVTVVTTSSLIATPEYKSTVVIKIDKENPNVLTFKDVRVERADEDYYVTQYEILKSRNLAKRVIRKLNLDKNKEFIPPKSELSLIKSASFFSKLNYIVARPEKTGATSEDKSEEDEVKSKYISSLLRRLEIEPVKNSRLVKVSFLASSPGLSQSVANAVAETYIEFDIESKVKESKDAKAFLESQIGVIRAKLEGSESALNDYAAKKGIIYLDANRNSQSLINKRLSDISSFLNQAISDRIGKESVYKEIMESSPQHPAVVDDALIKNLKERYVILEAEYYNLFKIYKPEYPKMKSLKAQMDTISKRIDDEKANIVESIESDYFATVKRESYLRSAYNVNKKAALDFQEKTVQYHILKRDVDANQEMYKSLLQRLKEVGVAATQATTNIQILDRAEKPVGPFKPNIPHNILLSIIAGLVGGVGLVFFSEYFDNTVRDTQEIEKRLQVPTLGMVPLQKSSDSLKVLSEYANRAPMLTWSGSAEPVTDAFRSIGTFISLSSAPSPPKKILITSPGEKEGKTTVCINTAVALLESMGKGIIIDADLRMPKLHFTFGVSNQIGLATFLSGKTDLSGKLIKTTYINGLDIITSGPACPNPSGLIRSERFNHLLEALCKDYDFIIIDSAPLVIISDSIYLSSIVDGTVLVVRAGKTSVHDLAGVKKIFYNTNARLIGVVLNGIKDSNDYGYYYSYYRSFNERKDKENKEGAT